MSQEESLPLAYKGDFPAPTPTSLMTKLAYISELLSMVAENLSNQDTMRLGLTSRALFHLCTPHAWRRVGWMIQLLKLIPGSKIISTDKDMAYGVLRLPCYIDHQVLSRFHFYAAHVKELDMWGRFEADSPFMRWSPQNWQALLKYSHSYPLLPNLLRITHSLSLMEMCDYVPVWIALFLGPSLLDFEFDSSMEPPFMPLLWTRLVLASLAEKCPRLRTLALHYSKLIQVIDDEAPYAGLLSHTKHKPEFSFEPFENLSILSTSADMLAEFSPKIISTVEKLDVVVDATENTSLPYTWFPNVGQLVLRLITQHVILPLPLAQTVKITLLDLYFREWHQGSIGSFLPLIANSCPMLVHLSISPEYTTLSQVLAVPLTTLDPLGELLHLAHLQLIHVNIDCNGDIRHAFPYLNGLLPCLDTLRLPCHSVTLSELSFLIAQWPRLKQLGLYIGLDTDTNLVGTTHHSNVLRTLESEFLYLPMLLNRVSFDELARFFFQLCPNAQLVFTPLGSGLFTPPGIGPFNREASAFIRQLLSRINNEMACLGRVSPALD